MSDGVYLQDNITYQGLLDLEPTEACGILRWVWEGVCPDFGPHTLVISVKNQKRNRDTSKIPGQILLQHEMPCDGAERACTVSKDEAGDPA